MAAIQILHLMNNFVDSSISRIVLRLAQNAGDAGIAWHIGAVSDLKGLQNEFASSGCRVVEFSQGRQGRRQLWRAIGEYIEAEGIGIVHSHTPRTILDTTFAIRSLRGVKHVATKHLLNTPSDRRFGLAFALWDRASLYLPDAVVAVSASMHAQICAQVMIDRRKVHLIRNAVPNEQFYCPEARAAVRRELGIPAESLVLGYTGRIDRVKRIDLLLQAFAEVHKKRADSYLVIAGEGSLKEEMQALAEALGVGRAVLFTGFYADIPGLLAAIDLYVQSSINEGLSLSILEAMAAEKAVIATNVGGAAEVIVDGVNGMLVRPESSQAIQAAIEKLVTDPALRTATARAGRTTVETEFSLLKMVQGYLAVYRGLVDAGVRPARLQDYRSSG